jgi:GTP-binding protein HflX
LLTGANVFAKDMPFATLDPTARQVRLPSGRAVVLSDTVGFITDLPTELVASFRATLEEVTSADVLIHVRDIAHAETDKQKEDVEHVLSQLEWRGPTPPIIEAWNKFDLLDPARRAGRLARAHEGVDIAPISARTGEGVQELLEKIDRLAFGATRMVTLRLDPADGRTRARYAREGRLVAETLNERDGMLEATFEFPASYAAEVEDRTLPRAAE